MDRFTTAKFELLNIIVLEMIGGQLYHGIVDIYKFNFLHSYGVVFETISTFTLACIMMEVILFISKAMNKNKYVTKIFFYR